jgi:hypothetical protein
MVCEVAFRFEKESRLVCKSRFEHPAIWIPVLELELGAQSKLNLSRPEKEEYRRGGCIHEFSV